MKRMAATLLAVTLVVPGVATAATDGPDSTPEKTPPAVTTPHEECPYHRDADHADMPSTMDDAQHRNMHAAMDSAHTDDMPSTMDDAQHRNMHAAMDSAHMSGAGGMMGGAGGMMGGVGGMATPPGPGRGMMP